MEALAKCLDDREYIKWNNKYCVGISIIDEQHKKLFGFLNKTIDAREHGDNIEELKEVLEKMTAYALEHFETEEAYMIEFDYPECRYHSEEHYRFFSKTMAYFDNVCASRSSACPHAGHALVEVCMIIRSVFKKCVNCEGLRKTIGDKL